MSQQTIHKCRRKRDVYIAANAIEICRSDVIYIGCSNCDRAGFSWTIRCSTWWCTSCAAHAIIAQCYVEPRGPLHKCLVITIRLGTIWMVDGTYIKASLALCLAYELKTHVMFFEPYINTHCTILDQCNFWRWIIHRIINLHVNLIIIMWWGPKH